MSYIYFNNIIYCMNEINCKTEKYKAVVVKRLFKCVKNTIGMSR